MPGYQRHQVPTFWDSSYHTTASPLLSTRKARDVVAAAQRHGWVRLLPSGPFDELQAWAQVERVHDPEYVSAVRTGEPRLLAQSQGFTWSPEFAQSVIHIWEGHQRAAHFALRRGAQVLHPVSGAHHARRSRGAGFCTFNFLVGAALMLVRVGRAARVCILDYDAHEGDGTLELGRDLDFLYLHSVALGGREDISPRIDYRSVSGVVAYRARYRAVERLIDRWRPDLVFYQAGMDPHEDDPVGGIPGVDADVLAERDAVILGALHARRIATVVNLAGGYQENGTTVDLHVETVRAMARLVGATTD